MNGNQDKQVDLVDSTDCLEAVGVFRGWKNFLFIIIALCLFLLQVSFWIVDRGCITDNGKANNDKPIIMGDDSAEIKKAAIEATSEPNQLVQSEAEGLADAPQEPQQESGDESNKTSEFSQTKERSFLFGITFVRLAWLIRLCNFVLILTATLYCLTMLLSIKISLIGRLGGINHICRAFFLSLVLLILILPWQEFFGSIVKGVIFTPHELNRWCASEADSAFHTIARYLRFTVYWLIVVLLLILSQIRSGRWTKAILRRLEVI